MVNISSFSEPPTFRIYLIKQDFSDYYKIESKESRGNSCEEEEKFDEIKEVYKSLILETEK